MSIATYHDTGSRQIATRVTSEAQPCKGRTFVMRIVAVGLVIAVTTTGAFAQSGLKDLCRVQPYRAARASSANPDLAKNGDARSIEAGGTLVLAELEGPGVVTHIWCTVGSQDLFYARSLVVRTYWDGADKPSVEAPLGDFFGIGHAAHEDFTSLPVAVSSFGRSRNCFWRMPFRKSARITVTNDSTTQRCDSFYYYVDWQKHESLPEDTVYFHARYRQETPAKPGDYTILETTGQGHYVGTVYSAHQMEIGWFGEGDDRFYVDGEEYPSLSGTGTEDYFGDAWGFRKFHTPYYGVSVWEGYLPGDRTTAYRWHIADPVTFEKSLKVEIEHRGSAFTEQMQHLGQFLERSDWVSSVAFWYQWPAVASDEPLAPVADRVAPYRFIRPDALEARATPAMILNKTDESVGYTPMKPDGTLEIDFNIADPGRYQITVLLRHSAGCPIHC